MDAFEVLAVEFFTLLLTETAVVFPVLVLEETAFFAAAAAFDMLEDAACFEVVETGALAEFDDAVLAVEAGGLYVLETADDFATGTDVFAFVATDVFDVLDDEVFFAAAVDDEDFDDEDLEVDELLAADLEELELTELILAIRECTLSLFYQIILINAIRREIFVYANASYPYKA